MPGDDEARPWARDGLIVENSSGLGDVSMIPPAPWSPLDVDLMSLSPAERALFDAGYRSGYGHGIERGRELRMVEERLAWRNMRDSIRRVTSHAPFSILSERRGESGTERAESARRFERRWGVASR